MSKEYLTTMIKLMSNPETKEFINDANFMKTVTACMKNPQLYNTMKDYDPRIKKAFEVISSEKGPKDLDDLKNLFAGQDFNFKPTGNAAGNSKFDIPTGSHKYDPAKDQPHVHEHAPGESCTHDSSKDSSHKKE